MKPRDSKARFAISLDYLAIESSQWLRMQLAEEEYFDPKYRFHDSDAILSAPRHPEPWRYISPMCEVSGTRLSLLDTQTRRSRLLSTSYWHGMNSHLTEAHEYTNDRLVNREMILSELLELDVKVGWLVQRWRWLDERWHLHFSSFIERLEDGSQRSHPLKL